ncbi:hypothetical protein CMK13_18365 [Candidatus Poribacteria bacterium]|nr:hypothetical protein [Candidatus Poribacteria bacterium]OUT54795.1 MAG: hypothetical protein CBB75_17665 [bacterium TMED15]
MNCQLNTKTYRLMSSSTFIILFLMAGITLASPPILYKPVQEHHADGRYHFNRLTDGEFLGAADLKVLTILFVPNGVTAGNNASSKAVELASQVQSFFQNEMEDKSHGSKTFELVKENGQAVVITINGAENLAAYESSSDQAFEKVKYELSTSGLLIDYPHQKFIYFVVFEGLNAFGQAGGVGGQFGPSGGMALLPRGIGTTDAPNFDMATIAHELGHAFGLDHDFRKTGNFAPPTGKHYIMSYDSAPVNDYVLSDCNADYLSVDRYFNRENFNGKLVDGTQPKVKINTSLAYASSINQHPVEFEISDLDGLHQVQFSVITDVPVGNQYEVANGSPELQFCQLLSGGSTTISYVYGTHLSAITGSKSLTAQARRLHIKVVDNSGQESYKNFTIYDQNRSPNTLALAGGESLDELLKITWPKDIISLTGTPRDTGSLFIETSFITLTSAVSSSIQSILARLIIDGASGTNLYSLNLNGVSLQSSASNVVIDNCVIESTDISGVYIDGQSSANLTGNTIQNCTEWGVYAKPDSMINFGGATTSPNGNLVQNNRIGVQLEGVGTNQQPVQVVGNTIQNNTQDGIVASLGAVVSIGGISNGDANAILNNGGSGISLFDSDTNAMIFGNTVKRNQGVSGIYVDGGLADITGNVVEENLKWGIYGKSGTQLTIGGNTEVQQNTIRNNKIGIQLEGVGTVQQPSTITGNIIQDNTENGIVVNLGTMVTIGGTTSELANSIFNNGDSGITLFDANTDAKIVKNTIKGNAEGIRVQGAKAGIDGNLIEENNGWGIYVYSAVDSVFVDRNIINKNKGGLISFEGSHPVILRGNLITQSIGSENEAAVWLQGAEGTLINNTIADNNGYGLVTSVDKPLLVKNTIFAGNQGANLVNFRGAVVGQEISYSLFDVGLPSGVNGNNNLIGAPQFVDMDNGDYHLLGTSPAINVGDNTVSGLLGEDLDGNPRISANTVDLGVYEYGSTSLIRDLAFISAAQSIDINQGLAKITVQLQDQNGTPIDAVDNLVVVLSSSSTSGTISSSVGGSAITSITILSGENQADFFYMDTVGGDVTLTAAANVGSPAVDKLATQILTVRPQTINELAFISPVQSIDINQDSAKITVQLQDQNGDSIDAMDNLVVVLSSSSTTGTISASVGGSAITSIIILSGENQAGFYYMDTVDGDVTLTATATVGVPAVDKSATQILTVNYIDLLPPSISSNLADTISSSDVETQGVTIQFSETMDISFGNIKLVKLGESIRLNRSAIEWATDKKSVTINLLPGKILVPGEDYTISLTGLVDIAGNELVTDDRIISFQAAGASQITVSASVQPEQELIILHLTPVAGGGDLTGLTLDLTDQILTDIDQDGFDDYDATIDAQYLTLKVFKESQLIADGLDANDPQVGPVISATDADGNGDWEFQVNFDNQGLAVKTNPVDLYLELAIQLKTISVSGAEIGQKAEVSFTLNSIQASVDVLPALDQSGNPIEHNWFDETNYIKENPLLLSVALTEDKSIIVNPTSLSVVDQLGVSTTQTFTITNTKSQNFEFFIKEATPTSRSISLVEINDDSNDDTDLSGIIYPVAISSVEAELNPESLELKILTPASFTIADLVKSVPAGENIALILLDTDRKNEGQLQPEDFGRFATDSSVGIDYVIEIQSMGANLIAKLINYTEGLELVSQVPVLVETQALRLSVPRRSLYKTNQNPVHVWSRLGDDYTSKGTVTPQLDPIVYSPNVGEIPWLSVQPTTGTLVANSNQVITATISTDQVGFSEAVLLVQDSQDNVIDSIVITKSISGIDIVRLSISPDQALLKTGQTLLFDASGEDLTGLERDLTTGLHWSILGGDTSIGSIDADGLFTAKQPGRVRIQVSIRDSLNHIKLQATSRQIEVITSIRGDSTGSNDQPDGKVDIFDLVNMANHWQETINDTTASSQEFENLDIAGGGTPEVINFEPALNGKFYDFSDSKPNSANLTTIENHVLDQSQMSADYTSTFTSIDFPNTSGSLKHQDNTDTGFQDYFLANFSGILKVNYPGKYDFYVGSDDGFRLKIDGQSVMEHKNPGSYQTTSASYVFDQAGEYAIDLSFFEWGGSAGVKLEWTLPGQGDGLVNIFDLVVLADNFGRGLSAPLTSPAAPSIMSSLHTEHQTQTQLRTLPSQHTSQINDSIRAQTGQLLELQALLLEGLDNIQAYSFDLIYDSTAIDVVKDSDKRPTFNSGTLHQSTEQNTAYSIVQSVQQDQLSAVKVSSTLLGKTSRLVNDSSQPDSHTHSLGQLEFVTKSVGESIISIRNLILINQEGQTHLLPDVSYKLQVHHQVDQTRLLQNYPNPFNPETWIPFELESSSSVTINIYDQQGQQVRQLDVGYKVAGPHHSHQDAAYWDGRNSWGEYVASGIYFYRIETDNYKETRKMVILK